MTELLRQGLPACFSAGGVSMTPTIRDGESVQVRPLCDIQPRRGDILLVENHGRLVLHRLIGRNPSDGRLRIVGDAALHGHEEVPETAVLGIAVAVLRNHQRITLHGRRTRCLSMLRYRLRPLRRWLLRGYHLVQ